MSVAIPPRALTAWEVETIVRLLDSPELKDDPEARDAWRRQIPALRVVERCECHADCRAVGLSLVDERLRVSSSSPEYGILCEGYLLAEDVAAVREGEVPAAVEEYMLFKKGGALCFLDACIPPGGPENRRSEPARIRFWQNYEEDTAPARRE